MSDLHDLEQKASRAPASVDAADHDRLAAHYWQKARDEDDFRTRRDLLKRAAFFVEHAVDAGVSDSDRLRTYLEILDEASEVHTFSAEQRRVQAEIRSRLARESSPDGPTTVRDRARGEVAVEDTTLILGDLGWQPDEHRPAFDDAVVDWMQRGTRLGLRTGADGAYPVEMRYVDGDEPRLDPGEMDAMRRCTSAIVLRAPSGRLAFGATSAVNTTWLRDDDDTDWLADDRITVDVPADSTVEACIYALPDAYVAIVAETSKSPPNDVATIEEM